MIAGYFNVILILPAGTACPIHKREYKQPTAHIAGGSEFEPVKWSFGFWFTWSWLVKLLLPVVVLPVLVLLLLFKTVLVPYQSKQNREDENCIM